MVNQYTNEEGIQKYLKERIGKRFGKLVVVERVGTDKHNNTLWKCKCDCGNTPIISMGALTRGHTKSCGCLAKDKVIDIRGQRFGRWLVSDKPYTSTKKGAYWECKCDCGTIKNVNGFELRNGVSKSCGCSTRLPEGESACKWLYNNYKINYNKKPREYKFELSFEDFKQITKQNCFYCGKEPKQKTGRDKTSGANGDYIYNGVDRTDNTKGYTKENCVPCCKICNRLKSDLTEKEFEEYQKRVREFNKNKKIKN